MEPVDDWARRLGRNKEPEPWPAFELRVADLGRRRHARKQWIALRRRDRKGPHRVGVDLRHGQREDVEHHRHMAGNEVLHCRRGSAVGNVNDVEPADLFELLGDDVAGASVPLRGVGQFARIGLRMRDQLLQRTGGDGGIDHQNIG